MPHPSVRAEAQAHRASGESSVPNLMPEVFAAKDDHSGTQEDRRRRATAVAAPAAVIPALGGVTPPTSAPETPPAPRTPTPPTTIDRYHKYSIGPNGGYIRVEQDHGSLDTDQTPPSNAGYRSSAATVSSVADAYALALTRLSILKPNARIQIQIGPGVWNEPLLVINAPQIDLVGSGRPLLNINITVGPSSDASFYDMDIQSNSDNPALTLGIIAPPPIVTENPQYAINRLYRCRLFGTGLAFWAQRRFYAEDCEVIQTSNVHGLSEDFAPVRIDLCPMTDPAAIRMKNCTVHSWYAMPDVYSGRSLDRHPGGFAIAVRNFASTEPIQSVYDYESAGQCVILDECDVYGSLYTQESRVEHIGGHQHGALPCASRSGFVYARLRGRPLFDPVNGYYADVIAMVTFDHPTIHSQQIAEVVAYNGAYPVGINPLIYPGKGHVVVRHGTHKVRYDTAVGIGGGVAFGTVPGASGISVADIVESSTGAHSWVPSGWGLNTYGSCPVDVAANKELYLM